MPKTAVDPGGLAGAGVYTPAFRVKGELLICSGIVPADDQGRTVGRGDAATQTRHILSVLKRIVTAAGGTMDDVVALRVFSTDMANRAAISDVRKEFFGEPLPASTHVEVSRLVGEDWLVEIEAIAVLG